MRGCFCFPSGTELPRCNPIVVYLLCSNIVRYPEEMAAATIFPPLGHLSEVQLEPGTRSQRVWATTTTKRGGQPWHPHLHHHHGSLQSRLTAVSKGEKARPGRPVPRKDLRITVNSPGLVTYMLTSTPSLNGGELRSLKAHADGFS